MFHSRQCRDRVAAAGEEVRPVPALVLAAWFDDAVQVLVEDREVLRLAPGERADERGRERPGGQRALAEEVAVQDRVLEHADLLRRGQCGLELLVVAARGGRGGTQVGEAA